MSDLINRLGFVKKFILFIMHIALLIVRKAVRKNKVGSVVIIALIRLGDTVFSVPAVRKIISIYPMDPVIILCYPESEAIYNLVLKELKILTVPKSNFKFGRRFADKAARRLLSELRPRIIFDLTCSVTSASLIFNSAAREIIGCSEYHFRAVYTRNSKIRTTPHLIDHYLDVAALAVDFNREPEIYVHELNYDSKGYILIHPLSVRKAKEWNLIKYISLALSLMKYHNLKFLIPQGTLNDDIINDLEENNIQVIITRSIEDLIEIIRGCSLYISNDTGPLYIANLMGKPTFTLYGPSNPEYSIPFGYGHQHIRKVIPCSPVSQQSCFTLAGVDCNHYDCMNLLTYDEVEKKVREFISELGITQREINYLKEE